MRIRHFLVLLGIVGSLAVTARADSTRQFDTELGDPPLTLDGTWVQLDQNMVAGDFFTGSYTWTSASPVQLTVTDWAVASDQFTVYDNNVAIFTTSSLADWPSISGVSSAFQSPPYTTNPDVALASGYFSNGTWIFGAGSHSITIQDIHIPPLNAAQNSSPFVDGTVAFNAEVVPLPAASWLGFGLIGLLAARRGVKACLSI